MKKNLELISYVSNYIPEFGYSTKEEIEFLPIDHPLAELAAQKALAYEDYGYLPGYIKMTYDQQTILSDRHQTGDLLVTWADLSYIIEDQEATDKYSITLLDYPIEVFVRKKNHRFYFELNEVLYSEVTFSKKTTRSPSIEKGELFDSIFKGYRDFINFCKRESLTFNDETGYESSIKTLNKISHIIENEKA